MRSFKIAFKPSTVDITDKNKYHYIYCNYLSYSEIIILYWEDNFFLRMWTRFNLLYSKKIYVSKIWFSHPLTDALETAVKIMPDFCIIF